MAYTILLSKKAAFYKTPSSYDKNRNLIFIIPVLKAVLLIYNNTYNHLNYK